MSSLLISTHEEAFRTLAREMHFAAEHRRQWMEKTPEHASEHLTAALTCGSIAQALERAADSLAERNEEIARGFSTLG